jgi:hypothetical protein
VSEDNRSIDLFVWIAIIVIALTFFLIVMDVLGAFDR